MSRMPGIVNTGFLDDVSQMGNLALAVQTILEHRRQQAAQNAYQRDSLAQRGAYQDASLEQRRQQAEATAAIQRMNADTNASRLGLEQNRWATAQADKDAERSALGAAAVRAGLAAPRPDPSFIGPPSPSNAPFTLDEFQSMSPTHSWDALKKAMEETQAREDFATFYSGKKTLGEMARQSPELRRIADKYKLSFDDDMTTDEWSQSDTFGILPPQEQAMTRDYVGATGKFPPSSLMHSVTSPREGQHFSPEQIDEMVATGAITEPEGRRLKAAGGDQAIGRQYARTLHERDYGRESRIAGLKEQIQTLRSMAAAEDDSTLKKQHLADMRDVQEQLNAEYGIESPAAKRLKQQQSQPRKPGVFESLLNSISAGTGLGYKGPGEAAPASSAVAQPVQLPPGILQAAMDELGQDARDEDITAWIQQHLSSWK